MWLLIFTLSVLSRPPPTTRKRERERENGGVGRRKGSWVVWVKEEDNEPAGHSAMEVAAGVLFPSVVPPW